MRSIINSRGYIVSYRGPLENGLYQGLWAVPGDPHWRTTAPVFDDAHRAEAGAAHSLCLYLNCELYPAFNRLQTAEERQTRYERGEYHE